MSAQMLQGGYLAVMEAKTPAEFREEVVRFAQRLGFKYVSAMTVVDHSLTRTDFHNVDNTPSGYTQSFNDTGQARRDPVMQHCKRDAVPII
jgi:hypothetical protein